MKVGDLVKHKDSGEKMTVVRLIGDDHDADATGNYFKTMDRRFEIQGYVFGDPTCIWFDKTELKQAVFKTFKNPVIDEDAVFAENVKYPRGLIYVIQVGAFRRDIPVNFYKSFAPVVKEYKSEGVYRYTAGFFPKYNSALIALKQIKSLGYKDAFIVALQDGQRIPLPKMVRVR